MIQNVLLCLIFWGLFVVFGLNAKQAFMHGSVWAKSTEVQRSEHQLGFWIATITSTFLALVCLFMALLCTADLIGIIK